MALSGSFNTSAYNGRYLTFSWTATQNVTNNTSTISWTLKCAGTGSGYYMSGNFKVVIAGETVYSSADRIQLRIGDTVATGSKTLTHNSDGTKTFTASAQAGIYTVAVNCTGSGSFTLNTIPRASTISCTNATINGWETVTISRASTAFTHTLTYKFGTLTGTIYTKTNMTSCQWIIPDSFYAEIPNAKSGTCTVTCQTYNGNTLIGTTTGTFTVSVNENECKPTLSPFLWDKNNTTVNLTGDDTRLIRYHSNLYVEANATARKNATLTDIVLQGDSTVFGDSYTFNDVQKNSVTFWAYDSRGYEVSQTETLTMVNYVHLTCVIANTKPSTSGQFTFEVDGNCFNGSFGASSNTLTVKYRYKAGNGSYTSWQTMTVSRSGNTYKATATLSGLDYQQTYTFQAQAADALESVTTDEKAVKSLPVFDWSGSDFNFNVPVNFSAGATGIGGGGGVPYGTCSTSGSVTAKIVNCDEFTTLQTGAAIRVKFSYANTASSPTMNVNGTGAKSIKKYGTTASMNGMWYMGEVVDFVYDGSYWVMVDGGVATTSYYGATKLQSTISNTDTVALTPGAVYDLGIASGSWTPSVINTSSYASRQGWYQKIGKCVTIGFFVNATFSSAASTTIEIYGAPFTNGPLMASGGGIVFNCKIGANTVFCGWVMIGNSTTIGARTYSVRTSAGGVSLGTGLSTNPSQTYTISGTLTYQMA